MSPTETPLTAQERIGTETPERYYVNLSADCCAVCGELIDSSRQIACPGTDVCANHAAEIGQ